jgi:cytochrome c553
MRALIIGILVLTASSEAFADAKAGEKKAQLCLLCHKPGNVMAAAPLLEAQPVNYLVAATTAYKTGKRPDPVMQSNVARLSARDISDIADYFASRPPISGTYAADAAKAALGERRVKELRCGTCHGDSFGGAHAVPRLAGQATGYLIGQLEAFAANRREHPQVETPFAKIGDIEAIAHYLTSLK